MVEACVFLILYMQIGTKDVRCDVRWSALLETPYVQDEVDLANC